VSKKIRIFAGPNGSGKTSLFNRIHQHYHFNIGVFINPDIVESVIKEKGELPFSDFRIDVTNEELFEFFRKSALAVRAGINLIGLFEVKNNVFILKSESYNSYLAAIISEFIRQKLFDLDDTFSTETVMSDPSKIELIKSAREKGFKVYLYYRQTM
jgi:predicted ABC-type ATPase